MTRKMMFYGVLALGLALGGSAVWTLTARAGYESAEYKVVEKDGNIEIREYPDLMLASTSTKFDAQGRDGSFMRLFRYISGANQSEQKIAMTTPVFMETGDAESGGKMGFVVPKDVADAGLFRQNLAGHQHLAWGRSIHWRASNTSTQAPSSITLTPASRAA